MTRRRFSPPPRRICPPPRRLAAVALLIGAIASVGPAAARPDQQNPPLAKIEDPADVARQAKYEACLKQARDDPRTARERAAQWEAAGGGALARHCAAIALIGQGAQQEAAVLLTETGSAPDASLSAAERSAMLRLAGDLWLRVGQNALAARCFETVLKLAPGDRGGLIGLARAAAADGKLPEAEGYLSELLKLRKSDAEALTLRAAARRMQGRPDQALEDAETATELRPASPLAWFERGAAQRALGKNDAARESWLRASSLDLQGQAGEEARHAIQVLDSGG